MVMQRKAWVLLVLLSASISTVMAAVVIGTVKIPYTIEPVIEQRPTMTPNPISLWLGTIPSGSSKTVDFGKVATISLPVDYKVTFVLDKDTLGDFETFTADVTVYKAGTTEKVFWTSLSTALLIIPKSVTLDPGDYDIFMEIRCEAKHVTEEVTGEVKVTITY